MNKLTIIGLGPGGKNYLTLEAIECIRSQKKIMLRTFKHPVVSYLQSIGGNFESFDDFYEASQSFDEVYQKIADEIIKRLENEPVIYAVPGNPFVAEKTVELLLESVDSEKIEIIHGASFIDAIITSLHIDPVHGLKIMDALKIEDCRMDVLSDGLVIQVYDGPVASRVKLKLMDYYEDEHEVIVIRGAGIPGEEILRRVPLYDLDRLDCLDHLTSVYVPRVVSEYRKRFFLEDLSQVVHRLRSPGGCPWDQEQTHESLRKGLIEETYEVIQAIDDGDLWNLEEELGDLLLQVVFHAEIASEQGFFNINDVITGIHQKMIRRHPHVFSDSSVDDVEGVLKQWDDIKGTENKNQDIPLSFPPLLRTEKILKQMKKAGVGDDYFNDLRDQLKNNFQKLMNEDQEATKIQEKDMIASLVIYLVYLSKKHDFDISQAVLDLGQDLLASIK